MILKYNDEKILTEEIEDILTKRFIAFRNAKKLTGGRISGVYKMDDYSGSKVIKYSNGPYRTTELRREAEVLQYMNSLGIKNIVPTIRSFKIEKQFQFAY